MIESATRPRKPNLVFVSLAGACPHIGKVVTPGVYFLPFFTICSACSLAQIASFVVETSLMAHKTCFHEF